MITKSVFSFKNYKSYLRHRLDEKRRGERSRLAEALGCHTGYVSQVLNGDAQLSIDQAQLANRFLEHLARESHFFLLLVQRERAALPDLRAYFDGQIRTALEAELNFKNRISLRSELKNEDASIYYSAWHYTAVHLACALPHLREVTDIAEYLELPPTLVAAILQFLESAGMVVRKNGSWEVGVPRVHLENQSPNIRKHHTNWRIRALAALDSEGPEDLHYSSVIGFPLSERARVKMILIEAIEKVRALVNASEKAQTLYCYSVDFFPVGNDRVK